MIYLPLLGLGLIVGAFSATIGIGGGVVIVPLLPLFLPVSPAEAIATSLATIFLVTVRNTIGFTRLGSLNWRTVLPMGIAAAIASLVVSTIAAHASDIVLKTTFSLTLLGLLAFVTIGPGGPLQANARGPGPPRTWIWAVIGGFCGAISGGTGVGSGAIAGPLIMRMRLIDAARVVPLVNGMMLINTASGLLGFASSHPIWRGWHWGPIWWEASLIIFAGAQVIAPFAIRHQHKMNEKLRKTILMMLLITLSIHSCWETYKVWNP